MQTSSKFTILGLASVVSIMLISLIAFESMSIDKILFSIILSVPTFFLSQWFAYQYSIETKKIKDALQSSVGNRELSQRIPQLKHKELNSISNSINQLLEHLTKTITKINANTETLFESGAQIAAASSNVLQASDQQVDSARSVTDSMNHLSAGITQIASNITEVRSTTTDANLLCQSGEKAINDLVTDINQVDGLVVSTSQLVNSLATRTSDIVSIIDVISSIAEQTNLLALNAAIEAARAGDQGRGFAVVADEVRNLAQRTHEATTHVTEMISAINSETDTIAAKMENSRKKVSECVAEANNTSDVLEKIFNHSSNIEASVNEIAITTDEQNRASGIAADKISSICVLSDQTNDVIHTSNKSIYGMLSEAIQLAEAAREYSPVKRNELNQLLSAITQIRMNAVLITNVTNPNDLKELQKSINKLDIQIESFWSSFKITRAHKKLERTSDHFWKEWQTFLEARKITLDKASSGDFSGARENAANNAGPKFRLSREALVELINSNDKV